MRTRPFTKSAGNRPDIPRNGRRSCSTVLCGSWLGTRLARSQVPDDLAYAMVRLYNSQYLAVEHLRLVSQLAASIIPAVEPVTLQTAAMRLYNTVMDFVEAHPDRKLLRIAEDGIITAEERPILDEILGELRHLSKVCFEVQAATEREV